MRSPDRRRSIMLLVAVLLPSTALVGIAARMIRQEHELAQRRALQARRTVVTQAGRELELAIDRIPVGAAADSVVVLATSVKNGRFALPWQSSTTHSHGADSLLLAGNVAEARGDLARADSLYAAVSASSHDTIAAGLAMLFRARTAARAGRVAQARAGYERMLAMPLAFRDEEGMPFALYAADWLHAHGSSEKSITSALRRDGALSDNALSRIALYALLPHFNGNDSLQLARKISDAERLVAVQRDYPALLSAARQQQGSVWLAYGPDPWLVRADSNRVVVVRPQTLLARSGVSISSGERANAEPLGSAFPGVYAIAPNAIALDTPHSASGLLLLILILTIGLTALSSAILFRDVRREVALAELRTQFVSSVSHELKTPLTAIRMYAEMLRMDMISEPALQEEFVDTIVHESERLTRLINNVLDFSRIERGERVYRPEAVDIADVAQQIERAMRYLSRQEGFDLRVSVEPNLPPVQADRDALVQAILNLISNAMKFSRVDRRIDLAFARDNGDVIIQVTDRGRGISATVRPHIFENFYRSPDVQADGIPGTGIGLALVAHVARGHGGNVVVESEPGKGSTFSLRLPVAS